jgi:hypothetical protein
MSPEKNENLNLAEGIIDFNLSSSNKLLTFTRLHNVSGNKYEEINIGSENGESIYSPPIDELKGGQVYVSEDKTRNIVNEVLDKRLGVFQEDE